MTQRQKALLSCAVAAALLLSGCRKGSSNSGSMSSSNAMSGSSGSASTTQTGGWKTGLGILTEASDEARTGTIHTIAAAVLLDGDGKLADVMLDELEVEVTADGKGVVTMPTDYRTKRQKGDDYPLAAASSLKKGWAEQADDFADYLTGMTPEQASMLETDKDGKAVDADLLSGCTIRVDQYRDAVAKACTNASALGAAKGDRVSLGVEAENASSDITATDDKDVNAEVDLTVVALTLDADGRVTELLFNDYRPGVQNLDLNIYVLERETLIKLVKDATSRGLIYFERDILAHNVNILNIRALEYTGYVAHVCDMKSYFDENLKLIDEKNLNALFPKESPVYTKIRDDNPVRYVNGSSVSNSLLADGCVIEGTVENCVLFRGVRVKKGAVVRNCVLMQDTVVEPGAQLDCVVTDKNVRVTADKKLSGTESFPVYVQKNHTV